MDESNVLRHYGVKGMKWGVRRKRGSDGRVISKDEATARKLKKKKAEELENSEIQTVLTRVNLTNQYKSIKTNESALKKGQKQIAAVLAVGATVNSVIAFARSPAGQAIARQLKK